MKGQSTHPQRRQWENLQKFNSSKAKVLGKGETHRANKIKEHAQLYTRINKSSPVK